MSMSNETIWRLSHEAYTNKRIQKEAVASAVMKLQMLGLTIDNGMVECPPPDKVHPFRWRAMIASAMNNGMPE